MPYIPHTDSEIKAMLDTIGVDNIETLFDEIAPELKSSTPDSVPSRLSEMDVSRLMHDLADSDGRPACFIGAGAYEHHIPAAVWQIATRGEFYTAYTPYQAEASQGTLQLLYEYQTMIANITAMEVSNASLYDGASALAEAGLMAIRANRKNKSKRILVPTCLHPHYRKTLKTIVSNQGIEIVEVEYNAQTGTIADSLYDNEQAFSALVISQPNFFGQLEAVDALTDWAHSKDAMVIAVCNPMTLAVLKPPGEWGETGADISCGDGQVLGIPLSSGGPYYGYMCAKLAYVRQMPGRIIGRTVDLDNKPGYSLTLQAREQHIRRSKATSNICTNQGLMVTASTIYMALMGSKGLQQVAMRSIENTQALHRRLETVPGISKRFSGANFHETVYSLDAPVSTVLRAMTAQNIAAGFSLVNDYPELGESLLVCVTETKTEKDLSLYADHLSRILGKQG